MPRFFVKPEMIIENQIIIKGEDVNHLKNVLRLNVDDEITINNGQDQDYYCIIKAISTEEAICEVLYTAQEHYELPVDVVLFQGLPKGDKMELIIQKCVELGIHSIVPVAMKRCIVKLDDKQAIKKIDRWQKISESAAKQARRGIIPNIETVANFKTCIEQLKGFDKVIVPYESAKGINYTKSVLSSLHEMNHQDKKIAIVIGPEGGFEASEIEALIAVEGEIITLGRRILRTETAGLAVLANIMINLEEETHVSKGIDC